MFFSSRFYVITGAKNNVRYTQDFVILSFVILRFHIVF